MLRATVERSTTVSLSEAAEAHLAAVTGRDLQAYLATVHEDVSLILPNGKLIAGRDAVVAFHADWFGDPDWSWKLTPVRYAEAGDAGLAVYAVEYHDVDGEGRPYTMAYVLTLTFTRRDGTWLLLHDQNTLTA
jgi:uncharacterized protein (TIGR02246 family)